MRLEIKTDYIKLDSFLKAVNAVGSGGQAKQIISDRLVRVNGQVELRRGRNFIPVTGFGWEGTNLLWRKGNDPKNCICDNQG